MPRPLLVGLSGPSSSGKTTLARLLRDILPVRTIIMHQDDFYRPEEELPFRDGLRDWDCAAALDLGAMDSALRHLAAHGNIPDWLDSKEDRNAIGPSGVDASELGRLRAELKAWAQATVTEPNAATVTEAIRRKDDDVQGPADVVIVDGFLLYGKSVPQLPPLFEARLMLRATYAAAKQRREARTGYVTIEGFWEDPPGYVDKVVWPGYVEEHAYLFKDGNVDGEVDEDKAKALDLRICPGAGTWDMQRILRWTLDEIKETLHTHWKSSASN